MTTVIIKKIKKVDHKLPDNSGLLITVVVNAKIGEVENKITDVSGLVKKYRLWC